MPFAVAAAATAGASLVSGYMGAEASEDASYAASQSSLAAINASKNQFTQTRNDLAPYRDAGKMGLEQFMWLLGMPGAKQPGATAVTIPGEIMKGVSTTGKSTGPFRYPDGTTGTTPTKQGPSITRESYAGGGGPGDGFGSLRDFATMGIQEDPGYQFRKSEGEKSLTYAASARGVASGSPGLKSLMRFNQGLASEEFNAAWMRKLQPLMTMMDMGQNAAAMTGSAGSAAANAQGSAMLAAGQASGAGALGAASSWNNAIQGGLSNIMYQNRYDKQSAQMDKMLGVFSPNFSGGAGAPGGMGTGMAGGTGGLAW